MDHPALFSPRNAAPALHDKLPESRILWTGEGCGSYPSCVKGGDAHVIQPKFSMWGSLGPPSNVAAPRPPHQRTMMSCRKAKEFRWVKDLAGIYALSREEMHIKSVDMNLIRTQA